jgi:hypothetical protein
VDELQLLAARVGSKNLHSQRAGLSATVAATFLGWAWLHSQPSCAWLFCSQGPRKGDQSAIIQGVVNGKLVLLLLQVEMVLTIKKRFLSALITRVSCLFPFGGDWSNLMESSN